MSERGAYADASPALGPPQEIQRTVTDTTVILTWRNPPDQAVPRILHPAYAATEVWGGPTADRTQARLLALVQRHVVQTTERMVFQHTCPAALHWYYWLRSVDVSGQPGGEALVPVSAHERT